MNQVNLIVDCNVTNLHAPARTMQARVGASLVVHVLNAPDDVTDAYIRVSTGGGNGYFDFPCTRTPNGDWHCRILGTAFAAPGDEWYEIRALDAEGNATALGGRGKCVVDAFSANDYSGSQPGGQHVIQTLLDERGAKHPIIAVQDEYGVWTYRIGEAV